MQHRPAAACRRGLCRFNPHPPLLVGATSPYPAWDADGGIVSILTHLCWWVQRRRPAKRLSHPHHRFNPHPPLLVGATGVSSAATRLGDDWFQSSPTFVGGCNHLPGFGRRGSGLVSILTHLCWWVQRRARRQRTAGHPVSILTHLCWWVQLAADIAGKDPRVVSILTHLCWWVQPAARSSRLVGGTGFNPHPPLLVGATTRHSALPPGSGSRFNPHPPLLVGATRWCRDGTTDLSVSILTHLCWWVQPAARPSRFPAPTRFNPHPPLLVGATLCRCARPATPKRFNPHPPLLVGATWIW